MLGPDSLDAIHEEEARSLHGQHAENLFPDFFESKAARQAVVLKPKTVAPPQPPGDSWMDEDESDRRDDVNAHFALLLLQKQNTRAQVEPILQDMGYLTVVAHTAEEAMARLRVEPYQLVFCDTEAASRELHEYMCCTLRPLRRRLIYYVLIGPELRTCYDMEALALSANAVVNERDLPYLEVILKRGFLDYEKLFGPMLEVLGEYDWPILQRQLSAMS